MYMPEHFRASLQGPQQRLQTGVYRRSTGGLQEVYRRSRGTLQKGLQGVCRGSLRGRAPGGGDVAKHEPVVAGKGVYRGSLRGHTPGGGDVAKHEPVVAGE
eukprot:1381793-Pyramimonas_sp.AAC.2